MIRITQKLVKEVKAHNNEEYRDEDWHKLDSMKEFQAVNFALRLVYDACDLKDVVRTARNYLEVD